MANSVKQRYVKSSPKGVRTAIDEAPWMKSNGTYISGRAHADAAVNLLFEMDQKWGVDRLRLLVSVELREKFDRQRYKFNQALWYGEMHDVVTEAGRMVAACNFLDKAAVANGAVAASGEYWEGATDAGVVVRIWRGAGAPVYDVDDPRTIVTYTLDEVVALLGSTLKFSMEVKQAFPDVEIVGDTGLKGPRQNGGWEAEKSDSDATPVNRNRTLVERNRTPRSPLADMTSAQLPLDDEIPF